MSSVTFTITENGSGALQSSPESQAVTTANTNVDFVLVGQAAIDYRITGYSSTDRGAQLSLFTISSDGNTMVLIDANTAAASINVSVNVEHRKHKTMHRVDPVIVNEPPQAQTSAA